MSIEEDLLVRSESQCELCNAKESLCVYDVPPNSGGDVDQCVLLCHICREEVIKADGFDVNHLRCLNDSMWSPVPAVQVLVWRLLNQLSTESWAQDLLEMLYLDDELLRWAKATHKSNDASAVKHLDSNGAILTAGDTVILIKDLNVKGAGFTAKRGTAVRSISLVADNAAQIEGRVNSQQIVILTQYVKKSN